MKVEIYGHSDDCIEVDGGKLTDEFPAYDVAKFLHFSDGTILEVEYSPKDDDNYRWRIKETKLAYGTKLTRKPGTYHGESPGAKCDKVILDGDIRWVRCYSQAAGPSEDDIERFFDSFDPNDLTQEQKLQIMDMCGS